jgi:ABC-type glutathione transport system ATPase component
MPRAPLTAPAASTPLTPRLIKCEMLYGVSSGAAELSGANRDPPALRVESLAKRFGDRVAFDDVSFEIGYGEVFGFLGPNGAGKTTTVRTLGGWCRTRVSG